MWRLMEIFFQEHSLLKADRALLAEFRVTEKQEYDHFSMLSFALRESHEKERAQAEKTKYWSIIGSIAGTIIGAIFSRQLYIRPTMAHWSNLETICNLCLILAGALASTLINRYRMQQLREMVTTATSETVKCNELILEVIHRS